MPAPIDGIVKRRVVQMWLAGEAREKIIADNDIGSGTVSIIVDEYKTGLDNFDLDFEPSEPFLYVPRLRNICQHMG